MPNETPTESLLSAARTDDRLRALKALRDRLAAEVDECTSQRELASLALRFTDVVKQIGEMERPAKVELPWQKETGLSEFERRLRERESAPPHPRSADA